MQATTLNLQEYRFRDDTESVWRFVHEAIAGRVGWWGWCKKPGMTKFLCMGLYSDSEVGRRVSQHWNLLTDDDRLDLHLWLKNWPSLN